MVRPCPYSAFVICVFQSVPAAACANSSNRDKGVLSRGCRESRFRDTKRYDHVATII
eukprot:COSAG06_NODE_45932_length_351_cov_0.607143_1_plen_56_part_10